MRRHYSKRKVAIRRILPRLQERHKAALSAKIDEHCLSHSIELDRIDVWQKSHLLADLEFDDA